MAKREVVHKFTVKIQFIYKEMQTKVITTPRLTGKYIKITITVIFMSSIYMYKTYL